MIHVFLVPRSPPFERNLHSIEQLHSKLRRIVLLPYIKLEFQTGTGLNKSPWIKAPSSRSFVQVDERSLDFFKKLPRGSFLFRLFNSLVVIAVLLHGLSLASALSSTCALDNLKRTRLSSRTAFRKDKLILKLGWDSGNVLGLNVLLRATDRSNLYGQVSNGVHSSGLVKSLHHGIKGNASVPLQCNLLPDKVMTLGFNRST
mmetsp:Transcript_48564/g.72426  ORF Transcript_48564/g.72426 Transcript_48564/m.72426 type:complete len:202 (-) Transcript_48564:4060-4665(-)